MELRSVEFTLLIPGHRRFGEDIGDVTVMLRYVEYLRRGIVENGNSSPSIGSTECLRCATRRGASAKLHRDSGCGKPDNDLVHG